MRVILFAALVSFASNLFAAAFGDTAVLNFYQYNGCGSYETVLSLPVSVSVTSRIYVSSHATYQANGTDQSGAVMDVSLWNSDNTALLATAQAQASWILNSLSPQYPTWGYLGVDGVLRTNELSPTTYVATPGNYVLQMNVHTLFGNICGTAIFAAPTLTYILLSAAFDRVFAGGFEAMLDSAWANANSTV